ncbi:hypothetical protein [Algoriphagus hitonicola]|uniref:Uncharacterized protein n=1 Tax=Algoriphagus hitonicola TaxID=435880 RepID=A0A1I2XPC1_9BACT|nr:hypothetical protein [Algoriphagus hitonicola]SFH15225.1 hypothetical protein SAMN04487988_12121 [Algoriphagus hitonicola]
MRYALILLFLVLPYFSSLAQVKFLARFEVESGDFDPTFEMVPIRQGLVSFRTISNGSFNVDRVFQYFISDENLNSENIVELPVKNGFDMIGYDLEGENLFIIFQKGSSLSSEKYVLQIDLETREGKEYALNNLLEMSLSEFLVQERSVIVMGIPDTRPVVQIFNLDNKSVHTVQGIYGNDTQILQIRKRPDIASFEVVLSRKGKYREREISINSYDLEGNLLREIDIDQFGDEGQEIMDAILVSRPNYRQMMVGAFGLERRNSYQGMYALDINEFGEYEERLYTLSDFPEFYNYLDERGKLRKAKEVEKAIKKEKVPSIQDNYSIRQVIQLNDGVLLYFDHYDVVNTRGNSRNTSYSSRTLYRPFPNQGLGGGGVYNPFPTTPVSPNTLNFQLETEFTYVSAHFIWLGNEGQVIWDNATTYNNLRTNYPESFGEIALVEDEFYHAYVRDDKIVLSYLKSGEKVFEDLDFEIELIEENERISQTNYNTLRLIHWYDRYFLLTGTQKIRYQKEEGGSASRDVYFVSKVLFAGDLYEPEEKLE